MTSDPMHPASTYIVASLLGTLLASNASANSRADVRVIVLRASTIAGDIETRIDSALLASLSTEAGFGQAEISPVPLRDLGLAAGCDDRSRTCLTRIAGTVDADVVIVRDLAQANDRPLLALTSFDALGVGAPIYVERSIEQEPDDEVAAMIRELYAEPLPASPSRQHAVMPPPTVEARQRWQPADESRGISAVAVVTLGIGVAALGAAAVFGIAADRSHDAYAGTVVRSNADANRALEHLETAEDRALAANILYGAGGALLAVGATLLLVDLTSDDDDDDVSLSVSASPVAAGIVLAGTTEAW
jgi:hypothetical protein